MPSDERNEFDDLFGDTPAPAAPPARQTIAAPPAPPAGAAPPADEFDNLFLGEYPKHESDTLNKKALAGAGALAGGYLHGKLDAASQNLAAKTASSLPVELAPVSDIGLQRYINSQISAKIPLNKLREITGMDIRNMAEAQQAIRAIQGSPAQRTPVTKTVDGTKQTVSYRQTPAQPPLDISAYEVGPLRRGLTSAANTVRGLLPKGAMGMLGGAVALPQLAEANKTRDWTALASGLGALLPFAEAALPAVAQRFGGRLGAAGAALSIPYAVKHRKELAAGMNMSDISPTAFMGMPGEMEPAFSEYTKGALP
jgi:hypothetical protein